MVFCNPKKNRFLIADALKAATCLCQIRICLTLCYSCLRPLWFIKVKTTLNYEYPID